MEDILSTGLTSLFAIALLCIAVCGGSYIILRPLVLWYLKIYSIVSELKENNALLRELIDELREMNTQSPSSKPDTKDYSKYMPKSFTLIDATDNVIADVGTYQIFTLNGRHVETLQKGVSIIRFSDGTTNSVYVK